MVRDWTYVTLDVLLFCSAYGLVRSRLTHPVSWTRFIYRRFIRVLPAFFIVMIILTFVEALLGKTPGPEKLFFRFSTLGFWFGKQGPLAADWFVPVILCLYLLFPLLFTLYEKARNKNAFVVGAIIISLLIGIIPIMTHHNNLLIFTTRIAGFILGIDIGYKVFAKIDGPKSITVRRAFLIVAVCWIAVAVLFTLTTDEQRGRYGLYWPPFIPAIVPLALLFSQMVAAMKAGRWQRIAGPFAWLLAFCGTYALEIILLNEPLFNLSVLIGFARSQSSLLSQAFGIINWGRYLEFALYAAMAMALAPLLHRMAEAVRKQFDAVVEGGQPDAVAHARRLLIVTLAILVIGVLMGIFFQKYYGFGRTLRAIVALPHSSQTTAAANPRTPAPPAPLAEIPPKFQGKMALFLLAGQSNMGGKGDLVQPAPTTPERIFVFGNDYRWHVAVEPVDNPAGQVDTVSQDSWAGAGPALPFALELSKRDPNLVIGLIPCAMEETTISQWARNLSERSLYGSCLKRARAASTMGEVAGLLFFQGEADAVDPKAFPNLTPMPTQWASQFSAMVNDFRSDLLMTQLPLVFAQIGTTTASTQIVPNWDTVKGQQRSVELPHTSMITTDDLPLQDEVHFTTASYLEIGRRFADAYWMLTHSNK